MGSLENMRMAENSSDVFLRCLHSLEFMDWFIMLDKYMIKSVIILHLNVKDIVWE